MCSSSANSAGRSGSGASATTFSIAGGVPFFQPFSKVAQMVSMCCLAARGSCAKSSCWRIDMAEPLALRPEVELSHKYGERQDSEAQEAEAQRGGTRHRASLRFGLLALRHVK